MNYHTMYRKVSAKKIIRTVNVKGESIVKGGKCTMEKMRPRPRTITIPPSKTCGIENNESIQSQWVLGPGGDREVQLVWDRRPCDPDERPVDHQQGCQKGCQVTW